MTVYERYTSRANILIQDGLTHAKMGYKGNSISDRMSKKTGLQFIARLLAIKQIIQKHGKEEKLTDDLEDELRIEENTLAQQIENSKEFKKTFEKATAYDLSCLLGNSKEDEKKPGRTVWEKINFEEFEKRYEKFPQTLEKRIKDDEELAAKEAKEQAEKEAEERRREEELAAKEAKRAKEEEEKNRQREEERRRIRADAENPDRVRRNMEFLDALGKHGPETKPEKLEQYMTYMQKHPSVRPEAQKVVHEKGLNIKVPELDLDQMDEKTKGSLFSQIDQLRKGLETWELDKTLRDLDAAGKKADEEIAKDQKQKLEELDKLMKEEEAERKRQEQAAEREAEERKRQQRQEREKREQDPDFVKNSRRFPSNFHVGEEYTGFDALCIAITLNNRRENSVVKDGPNRMTQEEFSAQENIRKDRERFKKHLAEDMATYNISLGENYKNLSRKEKEERRNLAKEHLLKSPGFHKLIDDMNERQLLELVGVQQKDGRWNTREMKDVMVQLNVATKEAAEREVAVRNAAKSLSEQLRQTSSKTFLGRVKSFFVGNSKEYDAALKAMEGLAKGEVKPEDAKTAIKGYLDIRKNKVRDHEYGRERFDCFMKGLNMVMQPGEFRAYCAQVDADRLLRSSSYKGHTYPEDYMPERSAQQIVNDTAKKATGKGYQPTEFDAATLIAGMRLGMDDHDEPLNSKSVRESAMNIMKDERFKNFIDSHTKEELKEMMSTTKGINQLAKYQNAVRETEKKNVPQQAVAM